MTDKNPAATQPENKEHDTQPHQEHRISLGAHPRREDYHWGPEWICGAEDGCDGVVGASETVGARYPDDDEARECAFCGQPICWALVRAEAEEHNTDNNRWTLRIEENGWIEEIAGDRRTAHEVAEEMVRGGDYGVITSTIWVSYTLTSTDGTIEDSVIIAIDPDEPECEDGGGHDWESLGVRGHGGGIICREVCAECGRCRVTDSWAQDPETGEQGLTSVRYEEADDEASS